MQGMRSGCILEHDTRFLPWLKGCSQTGPYATGFTLVVYIGKETDDDDR
jgi:hypothetical protein